MKFRLSSAEMQYIDNFMMFVAKNLDKTDIENGVAKLIVKIRRKMSGVAMYTSLGLKEKMFILKIMDMRLFALQSQNAISTEITLIQGIFKQLSRTVQKR